MYAEIHEVVAGSKPGRTHPQERILIHTTGLVSLDIALAHHLYVKDVGRGISLPAARQRE
jgi:ornithine cyclodeaminase/alanine dehydrogenase-like protein (mu-crystallin family)